MFEKETINIILKLYNNIKFISEKSLKNLELIVQNVKYSKELAKEIVSLREDVSLLQEFVLFLNEKKEKNNCNCENKLKEKCGKCTNGFIVGQHGARQCECIKNLTT